MKTFDDWTEVFFSSLATLWNAIMQALPNIIGAVLLILIGWVIAKVISVLVEKALTTTKFQKVLNKLEEIPFIKNSGIGVTGIVFIKKFVYWLILLLFFITASETLGWTEVSQEIGNIIRYLPKLFSAIVIFVIGLYIANFVKNIVNAALTSMDFSSGRIISSASFYIILVIISLMALNQAGIDTAVITSNFTLIIGAIMAAFAISFGLASREILSNILSSTYSRRNFNLGDKITVGNVSGVIVKIDTISITLQTEDTEIIIPAKKLVSKKVIKSNP